MTTFGPSTFGPSTFGQVIEPRRLKDRFDASLPNLTCPTSFREQGTDTAAQTLSSLPSMVIATCVRISGI